MHEVMGRGECPRCGPVDITDKDQCVLFMGKGLAKPIMRIYCESCLAPYLAAVAWEHAYNFDKRGIEVVGFSKATAGPLEPQAINTFMNEFDSLLVEFLDFIDAETD